jgi:4-alpha-glucanotransferase
MISIGTTHIFHRDAGILLHPSSLPNEYGIGDFGPAAETWIDLLADAGQSLWQVLPLGPAGYGDSPYQSLSAFAANPAFLSPDALVTEGLLSREEAETHRLPNSGHVAYTDVYNQKQSLADQLTTHLFQKTDSDPLLQEYASFCHRHRHWLDGYALFTALKENFQNQPWHHWPDAYRDRQPAALEKASKEFAGRIRQVKVLQFVLDRQWQHIREKARQAGIRIIGDLPIFVAHDSADVWCHPELFQLMPDGSPSVVAGVPPDYFSATGQRWGNPLYEWEQHRKTGFTWWKQRLQHLLTWTDVARIDHFRGFVACWEIPGDAEDATGGQWVKAPGHEFFLELEKEWGRPLPFIAEDLGVITDQVIELRDHFELPGIRVMQFAFGDDPMKSTFIPESFEANCVAYTGTHDNDTVQGWFNETPGKSSVRTAKEIAAEQKAACCYFESDGSDIHLDFIRALYHSDAGATIVPVQDILGLGSEARMNQPGKASGSWTWRLTSFDTLKKTLPELRDLTLQTRRGTASTRQPKQIHV